MVAHVDQRLKDTLVILGDQGFHRIAQCAFDGAIQAVSYFDQVTEHAAEGGRIRGIDEQLSDAT